jgi:hypothetical protein
MAKAPIAKVPSEEDEKPLDPAMEKVRRKMIRLLGVSIGVMMAGLMAVLFAIVYKMNSGSPDQPVAAAASSGAIAAAGEIILPEGAYLNGQSLSGDRISLDVTLKGGAREIQIFDMALQKVVARYSVTAK